MADYDCFPLWDCDQIDNLDPKHLPISATLEKALMAWAAIYDATLNREDPAQSGFPTPEAIAEFEQEGLRLWQALQTELGKNYRVTYFSLVQNRLLTGK